MPYLILTAAGLSNDLTKVEALGVFDTKESMREFYETDNQNSAVLYLEFPPEVQLETYAQRASDGEMYYNLAKISEIHGEPLWPKDYNTHFPQTRLQR